MCGCFFFFSSRRRHTRYWRDWSSDVCSSDLKRKKYMTMKDGTRRELLNTPNNKRIDNQYAIAVDKKKNYMLGMPPTIKSDNEELDALIEPIFNGRVMKAGKNLIKEFLNCGIADPDPKSEERCGG